MNQPIFPCLWMNNQAEAAANFYQTVFDDFQLISKNPFAYNFSIKGFRMMALNGGPEFSINSSVSFFVNFEDKESLKNTWQELTKGGKIMMELNEYPWSPYYGWCADQFGVNWQLMMNHQAASSIVPSLSFTQKNAGKAKEAMEFYIQLFPNSQPIYFEPYTKDDHDKEGFIKYSQSLINNQAFCAMDSSQPQMASFTEGISFVLMLDNQEEMDYYWNALAKGGEEGRCGWLKDQFGLSWQVTPKILGELINNPETAPKAVYNFMQMSKIIIADLLK